MRGYINTRKVIKIYSELSRCWRKHLNKNINEFFNLDIGDAPQHALAIQYSNISHVMHISPYLIKMEMELRSYPNKIHGVLKVFDAIIDTYDKLELEIELFQSKGFPYWSSEMYGVKFEPGTNLFKDIVKEVKAVKGRIDPNRVIKKGGDVKAKRLNELQDYLKDEYKSLANLLATKYSNLDAIKMFHLVYVLEKGYLKNTVLKSNRKAFIDSLNDTLKSQVKYPALNAHFRKEPKLNDATLDQYQTTIQKFLNGEKDDL